MRKLVVLILAILFALASCSYKPGVSEACTKYRFKDDVTVLTVPGWVIHLAANFADLEDSEREILESIDKVKILSIDNDDLNARIDLHQEFYDLINENGDYEELLLVREDSESVTILGRMDESVLKEMVILVGGDDNALIYVKGELKPELLNGKIDLTDRDKLLSLNF